MSAAGVAEQLACAMDDDLPVCLDGYGEGILVIVIATDIHSPFPGAVKSGVQCAVGVVARDGDVGLTTVGEGVVPGPTGGDDLAVGRDRDALRILLEGAGEVGHHFASAVERGVESPVRVVAGKGKVRVGRAV